MAYVAGAKDLWPSNILKLEDLDLAEGLPRNPTDTRSFFEDDSGGEEKYEHKEYSSNV